MINCAKCKYHYIKHTDEYSIISDCKKGNFKSISAYEVEPPKEFKEKIEELKNM